MLKKILLIAVMAVLSLNANYYTSLNAQLKDNKTIIFKDGSSLKLNGEHISFKLFDNLNYLTNSNEAKKLDKKSDLNTYNFAYLIQNRVPDKKFMLKIPKGFLELETKVYKDKIHSIIFEKDIQTKVYKYKAVKAYDKNDKEMDIKESSVLVKYLDSDANLIAIDIMDSGKKKVKKVLSEKVTEFEKEKSKRPVQATKFDFSKETLYLTYVSKQETSVKRMTMTYGMKKKNTKVILKSPISLLDPEYKGSEVSEHVGIFRDVNNALYEMKKVNILDGSIDLSWVNHPKKKVVQVQYITDGVKDRKILSKVKGQQFYSFEGTMYLASWMHKNKKDNIVFTFMNGSLPFDVTMTKTSKNNYEIQKKEQTIYAFKLDNNSFVTRVDYPAYGISIILQDRQNNTTKKNIEFLENFARKNQIKFIKE